MTMWERKPILQNMYIMPFDPEELPPSGTDIPIFIQHLAVQKNYEADLTLTETELSKIKRTWKITFNPCLDDLYSLYTEWVKRLSEMRETEELSKSDFVNNLKQMGVKVKRGRRTTVMLEEWITIHPPRKW